MSSRLFVALQLCLLWHLGCQECCNDHDCAVRGGANELCVDGACVEGDADVIAPAGCDGCDGDQVCVDDECVFAAECLRLDRDFVARKNGGAVVGTVTASSDGCEVTFAYDVDGSDNTASVDRIERDGTFTGPVGFDGGSFDSATRTGVLVIDAANTIRFGTDTYACVVDDDCNGQIFATCVAPADDDDGPTAVCRAP